MISIFKNMYNEYHHFILIIMVFSGRCCFSSSRDISAQIMTGDLQGTNANVSSTRNIYQCTIP